MALVHEDGTGKSDAESFVSLAAADTYHTNMATPAAEWSALTDGQREAALRKGTAYINANKFIGQKKTAAQALQWPRLYVYVDTFEVSSSIVPVGIINATCEAALRAAAGTLLVDVDGGALVKSESFTVGEISESKEYVSGAGGGAQMPVVNKLLAPYLDDPNLALRG